MKQLSSEHLHALSQSTTLTGLTSLNLEHCDGITRCWDGPPDSYGLVALLWSPIVKDLTHLNLRAAGIHDPEVYFVIATTPYLSNLTSLDLSELIITTKGVAALAASTTLVNLIDFKLSVACLSDQSFAQLFSPHSLVAKKLQSLSLKYTSITVSSLQLLLRVSPHLTSLCLASSRGLDQAGVTFIASSMPNLTKLDLAECNISDEGYAALAASTTLSNLRELNLNGNRAQATSIVALVNSPTMANLTHLDLSFTHNGPEVLTAIAQSPAMSKLQRLDLDQNAVGYQGILALARSTTLSNLTTLDLSQNRLGPQGVKSLCTSPVVSKLTHLNLGYNGAIGNAIAPILAAPSSTLYNLVELNLAQIKMDDEGVLQLLAASNLDQLNNLIIVANTFEDDATKAVYRARFHHHF